MKIDLLEERAKNTKFEPQWKQEIKTSKELHQRRDALELFHSYAKPHSTKKYTLEGEDKKRGSTNDFKACISSANVAWNRHVHSGKLIHHWIC